MSFLPNEEEIKGSQEASETSSDGNEAETEEAKTGDGESHEESTVSESSDGSEDSSKESDEVPASVQKRIDQLTYKYKSEREARQKLEEQLKANRQDPSKPTSEEEQKEKNARDYLSRIKKTKNFEKS